MALHRPHYSLVPQVGPAVTSEEQSHVQEFRQGSMAAEKEHFMPPAGVSDPQFDDAVSLGTTIMALSFDGGVILAADSRTSTGTYVVNRVSNKLTKLADNIYCCRSGSAADTQAMAEMTHRYLNSFSVSEGRPPLVATGASLVQRLVYSNRWNISAGIIVAGYDEVDGASVYNIPLGAKLKHDYAIGGSGSTFLYAWFDEYWKPGMSKDECLAFAQKAVAHALSRDGSSGGVIRTIIITKDGTEHNTLPWPKIPYCMEKDKHWQGMAAQNQPIGPSSKTGQNETEGDPNSTV